MRILFGVLMATAIILSQAIKIEHSSNEKKFISHYLSQTYSDMKEGNVPKVPAPSDGADGGGESLSAKDYGEILGAIDVQGLKEGKPKAITNTINSGVMILDSVLKSTNALK